MLPKLFREPSLIVAKSPVGQLFQFTAPQGQLEVAGRSLGLTAVKPLPQDLQLNTTQLGKFATACLPDLFLVL